MCRYGAPCIFPAKAKVLPRNNWTGGCTTIKEFDVGVEVHSLFDSAYLRAVYLSKRSSKQNPPPTDGAARAADDNVGSAGVAISETAVIAQIGGDANPIVQSHAAGDSGEHLDKTSIFRQEKDEHIEILRDWLQSGKCRADIAESLTFWPTLDEYVLNQLSLSGSKWERKQQ